MGPTDRAAHHRSPVPDATLIPKGSQQINAATKAPLSPRWIHRLVNAGIERVGSKCVFELVDGSQTTIVQLPLSFPNLFGGEGAGGVRGPSTEAASEALAYASGWDVSSSRERLLGLRGLL